MRRHLVLVCILVSSVGSPTPVAGSDDSPCFLVGEVFRQAVSPPSKVSSTSTPLAPSLRFRIHGRYPHNPEAFTQGLVFDGEVLYESTGIRGHSSLNKLDWKSGRQLVRHRLDTDLFGEGLTLINGRLIQLTWQAGVALYYRKDPLQLEEKRRYFGEAWGSTTLAGDLVISNGTDLLIWLDPTDLSIRRSIRVKDGTHPIQGLNELESVEGQIMANVWPTDCIARIDPASGQVTGWLDLSRLRPHHSPEEVLNGIAYHPTRHRLFVTGKYWPQLYELEILPETTQ